MTTAETRAPVAVEGGSWNALPVILAPAFMIGLDSFIVDVAIAAIQRHLHASAAALEFIASGFNLVYGAGLITAGRLGDLYGRRRLFMMGLALFTAASACCGLAPDTAVLVAARAAQGLGATLMTPQALALLGLLYSGSRRGRAMNAYSMTVGLSSVLGQVVGGLLIGLDPTGWGWCAVFLINVPVGLAALVLAPRLVPDPPPARTARLDLGGAALASGAVLCVVVPLVVGPAYGWPTWARSAPAAALVLALLLASHLRGVERSGGVPLIAPAVFRRRAFSVGLAIVIVFHLAVADFFVLYPYWLQQARGLSALAAGLCFLPLSAGFLAASAHAPRFVARLRHQTLAVGALLLGAGYLLFALTVARIGLAGSVAWLTPSLLVCGFGMGTVLGPLISLVIAEIPPRDAAAASGALSSAIQMGNAIGVAVVGLAAYRGLGGGVAASSVSSALVRSVLILAALALAVAVLVQFLAPRHRIGRHRRRTQ
jgi:EmrB/QacA subfamily drug resistance transporter